MKLYLDASVLLARLNEETRSKAVRQALIGSDTVLVMSSFAAGEVASGIARLVRMGSMSSADGTERLSAFDIWAANRCEQLSLDDADVRVAGAMVRRFEAALRLPDAIHLSLCKRHGHMLVTLDSRLAEAAAQFDVATTVPA